MCFGPFFGGHILDCERRWPLGLAAALCRGGPGKKEKTIINYIIDIPHNAVLSIAINHELIINHAL